MAQTFRRGGACAKPLRRRSSWLRSNISRSEVTSISTPLALDERACWIIAKLFFVCFPSTEKSSLFAVLLLQLGFSCTWPCISYSRSLLYIFQIYKMSSPIRGRALVINNISFAGDLRRNGSDVDVDNITAVWKQMNLEVVTKIDLTAQVVLLIHKYNSLHSGYICCTVI